MYLVFVYIIKRVLWVIISVKCCFWGVVDNWLDIVFVMYWLLFDFLYYGNFLLVIYIVNLLLYLIVVFIYLLWGLFFLIKFV